MKPSPFLLLAMFALLVFVALQTQNKFDAAETQFVAKQDVKDSDDITFYWRDGIEHPMSLRLAESFEEWGGKTKRIIIDFSSPGGSVAEGREVIDIINQMKKTHVVQTRVQAHRICLSMCVPIYLQGSERVAAPASRWMFHEPASFDAVTGDEVKTPEFEKRRSTQKFVDEYFKKSDMKREWLVKLESEWKGKDVWKTGRELVEENSGIILQLE